MTPPALSDIRIHRAEFYNKKALPRMTNEEAHEEIRKPRNSV